ncbi:MAG: mitochondrial fission ELM1 family protein [Deltaproteobacteria bacterium]|nr:mitochondrial fission ELM1 family protein [Deltaproteobacteria bacterium]
MSPDQKTEPLKVAAFWDTRPGHRKQTSGVLTALSARTPIVVHDFSLPYYSLGASVADWAKLVGHLAGLPVSVPHFEANRPVPPRFDLILGTGSHTHVPMTLFKRRLGGRLVTCMTPDPLLSGFFDLCLVPEHDRPKPRENVFLTLGPPNPSPKDGPHRTDTGLILVGGVDEKSHEWDPAATVSQISAIARNHPKVFWTVSSSPRTPADMLPALERLTGLHSNLSFFRSADTPPGWVEERYAESAFVWVTADSVSMIYEALTAGCVVGVMPVKWKKPDGKIPYGLQRLRDKGMIIDFDAWLKNPDDRPTPFCLDEAGRSADEILRRFFPDRLK